MIDSRLQQVLQQVKENVAVPVILDLTGMPSRADLDELAQSGLRVTKTSRIHPTVYGRAMPGAIASLDALPFVARVFYDEPVYAANAVPFGIALPESVEIPIGESVAAIGAPALWEQGVDGKGVKVAVIDTGVSQSHEMLRDAIKGSFSAVPGETVEDANGHGSWCAGAVAGRPVESDIGTLVGAAPGADLYCLKALSDAGTGQMSWVMDCIEKAVLDFECPILSMSLGSMTDNGGLDPISRLVNEVTLNYGTICVVAAGNSGGPVTIGSPGGAISALTVGSVALKLPRPGMPSTFSSKGPTTTACPKPDISAPGGNVVVPVTVVELIVSAGAHGTYFGSAGTSMATPQVAGAVALLKQVRPCLTREDLEAVFSLAALPRPKDPMTGYGMLHVEKAAALLDKVTPDYLRLRRLMASVQAAISAPLAMLPRPQEERAWEVRLPVLT